MSRDAGNEARHSGLNHRDTTDPGIAGLRSTDLCEWLPGVFCARFRFEMLGVCLPDGRIVGEFDRVTHLFPLPDGVTIPETLTAYCRQEIRPGQAEQVQVGDGMPCMTCFFTAPNPNEHLACYGPASSHARGRGVREFELQTTSSGEQVVDG